MGAKDCKLGNGEYKKRIAEKINELLSGSHSEEGEIRAVILSGMLTSELGICHIPHLTAPVGIKELHDSMRCVDVGISSIPCYFIPGVRIQSDDVYQLDMMRGEECEFFGIADMMSPSSVCIMPGSHTKHVFSDGEGRISFFRTFLSGEMIAALSQSTILSKSVDLSISDFDEEALLSGYDSVRKMGINRTLFQTRIMDNILNKTPRELYSFFLGAILCEEVLALADCEMEIFISGQRSIRKSMIYLIKNRLKLNVSEIGDHDSELASAMGAIKIFEYKGD
jgi:2-dehydro-3-deoxygalactonokinase